MVESHLVAGAQKFSAGKDDPANLAYGQSITDACIGWEDSVGVLQVLRRGGAGAAPDGQGLTGARTAAAAPGRDARHTDCRRQRASPVKRDGVGKPTPIAGVSLGTGSAVNLCRRRPAPMPMNAVTAAETPCLEPWSRSSTSSG